MRRLWPFRKGAPATRQRQGRRHMENTQPRGVVGANQRATINERGGFSRMVRKGNFANAGAITGGRPELPS